MANLRTNNLCGEGGKRAYRGSVFFDGRDSVTGIQVIAADSNDDFTLGTGDFALEMWIFTGVSQSATLYDGRKGSAAHVTPHIDLSSNVVRYLVAGTARITGSSTLSVNSWHHISVERQSGSTKLYVNGIQEGSTYSDSNSYVAKLNRPVIGAGDAFTSAFNGYISNVRLCKGHIVYGSNFTPPTSELVVHDKTVLLCCQDSDNPLQEATGKEMLGQGGTYFGRRYSNLATNGDLETGDTTNWANSGCDTFEVSNFSHSGSYSLHAVTNSNGDAVAYVIPVTLDTEKRYKISAYINVVGPGGTSARAKMKIGSGAGGNENYESEVVGDSNNGLGKWAYVEWIGLATADTTHVTFNESSANNVNDYYIDDLRIELWYPEEGVNILANPRFTSNSTGGATGWQFTSGNSPSNEWSIANGKLSVTDTSRTNDAIATQQLYPSAITEGRYLVTLDYTVSVGDFDIGIGNGRLFGVANTHNGGAGANATFTAFLDPSTSNANIRLVANQYCVADFHSIHLSRVPEPKAPKKIPPYGVDAGNTFDGAITMNSSGYMCFPTGTTEERGRGRAVIMGGVTHTPSPSSYMSQIDFFNVTTLGNSMKFGDLSYAARAAAGAVTSTNRAIYAGGMGPSSEVATNSMSFITIPTQGNGLDYGDLTAAKRQGEGCSNGVRGLFMGGENDSPASNTYNDVIDYCTIASIGNALDFGNLSAARDSGGVCSSPTRGVCGGGFDSGNSDVIDFVTIATTGNATDFGNLTAARTGATGCASATRGLFMGGRIAPSNKAEIDFITIASTGNASDFGDLSEGKIQASATASQTRGVHIGGNNGSSPNNGNTMEFVTIATTGNVTDFGDTYPARTRSTASDCHGGLS